MMPPPSLSLHEAPPQPLTSPPSIRLCDAEACAPPCWPPTLQLLRNHPHVRTLCPPFTSALRRCSEGRATLLVTTLPQLRTRYISEFSSRADLMRVVMASAHIPVVLDWRMFVRCRGSACVDGGLW